MTTEADLADALPPLPAPLVMVNRYGTSASTSDGYGGVFTADQMRAYALQALRTQAAALAERESDFKLIAVQDVAQALTVCGIGRGDASRVVAEFKLRMDVDLAAAQTK